MQGFIGLANWFTDFIPDYAKTALPLTNLLRKDEQWKWTTTEQAALNSLIDEIQGDAVLALFDAEKPVEVFTDASDFAVGGWIGQKDDTGALTPIVFYSRKLKKAELNYSVTDKELLAIVTLADAHRPYLAGKQVLFLTDHRPLTWLQGQPVLSGRQARWVTKLQELNMHIEYLPGHLNTVAGFLSRQPAVSPKCSICGQKK